MTPEKREAAIKWLTDEIRSLRMAPSINGCGPENWAEQLEIMETCLEAVRGHGAEPLTIEQLREMDGKPVWVKVLDTRFNEENQWAICNAEYEMVTMKDGFKLFFCGYELNWRAYAYPPAHIDREAWEPCGEMCRNNCATCDHNADELFGDADYCKDCHRYSKWEPSIHKYCERCGRPRTPDAWAELEKRLRG